jgi:hypothetical protein
MHVQINGHLVSPSLQARQRTPSAAASSLHEIMAIRRLSAASDLQSETIPKKSQQI